MSIFTNQRLRSSFLFLLCYLGVSTIIRAEEVPMSSVKVSYYADYFTGQRTANGEYYKPDEYTCAHTFYPFGTLLKLKKGKKAVIVRVNDRGPFVGNRMLDLSYIAAKDLGIVNAGVAEVSMELFDPTFYETSDTILLAKVLSPDDKRFKLAMNVAKIEREAKQKEKIAELEAKNAAKKGKGKKEKKQEVTKIEDKKTSKKKEIDKKKKSDKSTTEKVSIKSDKLTKDKSSKKEVSEKNETKENPKTEKLGKVKKEVTLAEAPKILVEQREVPLKEEKNEAKETKKPQNLGEVEKKEKKMKKVEKKIVENLDKQEIMSSFATDINSTPHNKSSKWWIFPWIVVIVGLVFGVVIRNKD